MDQLLKQSLLYDFYGELLTEHQRRVYEEVVQNDLSYSEAAESFGVSRQGIHELIKRCNKMLESYEERLHLVERFLRIRSSVQEIQVLSAQHETIEKQALAEKENVVMDGRDIGTCVLPNADVKVYLDASSHVRAVRRYEELKAKGEACDLAVIEKDIIERDYRDMNREISPLKRADDAHYLDSSDMTIEQVADAIIKMCD